VQCTALLFVASHKIGWFYVFVGLTRIEFVLVVATQSFNAASQNQCRLDSGAWFSMGSTVAYLIVAILCTSIDPYVGKTTRCCCFVTTRNCCPRNKGDDEIDEESIDNNEDKVNVETSVSSGDGQNWRDIVNDDEDDQDFGSSSNMEAGARVIVGDSMPWSPLSDESKDEERGTQTSSELLEPASDLALNSASLDSNNAQEGTESPREVPLTKEDSFLAEVPVSPEVTTYKHTFPRKPDFLDMCCAGDPLQVEKHLEYPVELKKVKGTNIC